MPKIKIVHVVDKEVKNDDAYTITNNEVEESELPRRPHNIITPNIKPRDFFTVICEQSNPYKRANKKTVFSCSPPEFKDKYINSSLFKTNIPTSLDRKK